MSMVLKVSKWQVGQSVFFYSYQWRVLNDNLLDVSIPPSNVNSVSWPWFYLSNMLDSCLIVMTEYLFNGDCHRRESSCAHCARAQNSRVLINLICVLVPRRVFLWMDARHLIRCNQCNVVLTILSNRFFFAKICWKYQIADQHHSEFYL